MLKSSTVKQVFLNISKMTHFGKKKKRRNDTIWHKNNRFVFNLVFFNIGLDFYLIIQTTKI